MNTWYTENGRLHNNVYIPDDAIAQVVQRETRRTAPVAPHRDLSKLAHAGLFGILALAVIAIVAGILAILPKPLRVVVILAALGWIVWSVATLPKTENPAPVATQQNEVVSQPTTPVVPLVYDRATGTWIPDNKPAAREPEVRRATLVNPHPKR